MLVFAIASIYSAASSPRIGSRGIHRQTRSSKVKELWPHIVASLLALSSLACSAARQPPGRKVQI